MPRFARRSLPTPRPPQSFFQAWTVALLAALLLLSPATPTEARAFDEPIFLDAESLNFMSCFRLKEDDAGSSCYHGAGWFTGCAGSCGYATIDLYDLLRFECDYRFTGEVYHAETGEPVRDLPIHLLLPDQSRASTRTDGDGFFSIAIESPDTSCFVQQGFDRLRTLPDDDGIVLTSELTEAFRERYPEHEVFLVPTQKFRKQR